MARSSSGIEPAPPAYRRSKAIPARFARSYSRPTGQLLASASYDHTVKLWDRTGACLQTFAFKGLTDDLSFDSTGRFLYTSVDTFILNLSPQISLTAQIEQEPCWHGYRFSGDGVWIMYNTDNILWLPPDYRPVCSAVTDSKVAIGCHSGRILLLGF